MPNEISPVPPVPVPPDEIAQLLAVLSENNARMLPAIQEQLTLALNANGDRVTYDRGTDVINASTIRRDIAANTGDRQVLLTHYREANPELINLLITTQQRVRTAQALAAQRNVV